jgi:glycosyltransferase involved in cell wall biosynthesis
VVATRSGGPEWLVEDGAGALVPVGDPTALAAALRQVREQTAAGRFDPQRIRDGCLRRFAEPVVLGRLATIYRELAAARPSSR